MKNINRLILLFIPCLILLNESSFAQKLMVTFESISQKNGLSNNAIKTMIQDKTGFMWFGSINGLNRFDGKEMVVFNNHQSNKSSISNDYINCLKQDATQNLWIGTAKGINKYDPSTGTFQNFNNNPDQHKVFNTDFVFSLEISKSGVIWLGTRFSGLFRYDNLTNSYEHINLDTNSAPNIITSILEDNHQDIWVGTQNGLFKIKQKNKTIIKREKLLNVSVNVIYQDKEENLWVGTTNGLFKLPKSEISNLKNPKFIIYKKDLRLRKSISHNDVTAIFEDKDGQLWIGTDGGGLNRTKVEQNSPELEFLDYQNIPDNSNSLRQNQVFSITQDVSGIIWVGTNNGINKIKKVKKQFIHFQSNPSKPNSLENNNLAAIENMMINGKEFIICGATGGSGMDIISSADVHYGRERFIRLRDKDPELNNRKYQSFLISNNDSLWIGTKGGLRLYSMRGKKFLAIPKELINFPKCVVRKLHKDRSGKIWIGTNKGLFIWNVKRQSLVKIKLDNSNILDNDYRGFIETSNLNNIFAITEDEQNNVWVGTWGGGLLKFKPGEIEKPLLYQKGKSNINSNYVVSLLYNDKKLWIGTANGLSLLEKPGNSTISSKFKVINLLNPSSKKHIAGILADKHHNLWLATLNSIVKYNIETGEVFNYEISQGDLTKENYKLGMTKDAEGYLYFGGINGLVSFHPDSIKPDTRKYPIVLTDFRIFKRNQDTLDIYNRVTSFTKQVSLSPKEYAFSFSFSSLNYNISSEINYAYMLEGIDKTWINIKSDQHFATYSNLNPGRYTLKVKATNEYGIWSAPQKLLTIKVLTPWWLSWWAYSVYVLLAGIFVYAIVKYVLEKERLKNNLVIERLEKQRVKEVDELKFRYFTNISHEFRTPLTLILGPLELLYKWFPSFNDTIKENLGHIQHNVNHLLRLINQLMDFRKLEEGNLKLSVSENYLSDFIRNIGENFDLLASKKSIDLILEYQGDPSSLIWCDWDKLEKILNNLIHNALSFTPFNGEVIIRTSLNENDCNSTLSISIIDSGKGIPTDEIKHIFDYFYQASDQDRSFSKGYGIGLSLTHELVKIHKGKIEVSSDGIEGTTFTVTLPVNRKDYRDAELSTVSETNLEIKILSHFLYKLV